MLLPGGTSPRLLATGHLAFYREGTVFVQRFDERTATVSGTAVPMVQRVLGANFTGAGQFSVSASGTIVFIEGSGDDLLSLAWVDRAGKVEMIAAGPRRRYFEPRLSPDGTMIATATRDESPDIYVWHLGRNTEARVTRDEFRDNSPLWLDNRELLFATETEIGGPLAVARRRVDLTTERTIVAPSDGNQAPTAISRDGKTLVVTTYPGGTARLGQLSLQTPAAPELLFGASYLSANAAISPDGRWIAYEAREGERNEVYVRPFPNINDSRVQISQGGGSSPAWSRNGRELFYLGNAPGQAERPLIAVPVKPAQGTTFDWGQPTPLFNMGPYLRAGGQRGYDVSLDGARFVVAIDPNASGAASRTVMRFVTNWFEELHAKLK